MDSAIVQIRDSALRTFESGVATAATVLLPLVIGWIPGIIVFTLLQLLRLLHEFIRRISESSESHQQKSSAEHVSGHSPTNSLKNGGLSGQDRIMMSATAITPTTIDITETSLGRETFRDPMLTSIGACDAAATAGEKFN